MRGDPGDLRVEAEGPRGGVTGVSEVPRDVWSGGDWPEGTDRKRRIYDDTKLTQGIFKFTTFELRVPSS